MLRFLARLINRLRPSKALESSVPLTRPLTNVELRKMARAHAKRHRKGQRRLSQLRFHYMAAMLAIVGLGTLLACTTPDLRDQMTYRSCEQALASAGTASDSLAVLSHLPPGYDWRGEAILRDCGDWLQRSDIKNYLHPTAVKAVQVEKP